MTTPTTDTPTRKLIDVDKIVAILDAEKHLIHGALVEPYTDPDAPDYDAAVEGYQQWIASDELPQPGPLAVAHCEHAGHCAMGALLLATGKISPKVLDDLSGDATEWDTDIVKLLYQEYGIQRYHATTIIAANDLAYGGSSGAIAERRRRVEGAVRELAERQRTDPETDLDKCREHEDDVHAPHEAIEAFKALDLGDWNQWTGGDWE